MTTRSENTTIFQTEVRPPVKTESLVIEVSIIEAATKIDKIAGTKVLLTVGTTN
jgi:hypothetical protein